MNSQQDDTGDTHDAATGDSAPTDSEALSNRFPGTVCACGHDHDEHNSGVGCLHGWGGPPRSPAGCHCRRFASPSRHAVYIQFDDPEREPWYHPHAVVVDNGDGTLTVTPGEHQALTIERTQ